MANHLLHVKDGASALDFIFAEGEYADKLIESQPKLVMLDLKMPKINGKEVLLKIKSDQRTKKIPVVIFTSSKEDPDIQTCYSMGANGYVVKPVEFEAFHKTISDLGLYWLFINHPHQ